jgi:hypothetical protein
MAVRGPTKSDLALSWEERNELLRWSTDPVPALVLRSTIVLAGAAGESNVEIAARLGVDRTAVSNQGRGNLGLSVRAIALPHRCRWLRVGLREIAAVI